MVMVICHCNNGNCADDFANWKYKPLHFHEGSLDWIEEFSIQYAVVEEHVTTYVQHMEEQKACALIRTRETMKKKCNKAELFRRLWLEETTRKWQTALPDKTGAAALFKAPQTFLDFKRCFDHGNIHFNIRLKCKLWQECDYYHVDNSSEDSDSDEGDVCSSADEFLAAGLWSEGDEEEEDVLMIPETVIKWSGRVASRVSTVILH